MAEEIMQWFTYEHLKPELQALSKPICDLAREMEAKLPPSEERTQGLRKLMEAKDCLVRASMIKPQPYKA